MVLTMQHNTIVTICDKLTRIAESIVFDLSYNSINKIESNCFHSAAKLKIIRLNNDKITRVHHKAFNDLPVLCYININMNLLSEISPNTINNCPMIYLLTLQKIRQMSKRTTMVLFMLISFTKKLLQISLL